MAASASPAPNVGFLAILNDPGGALGGYLVTNAWGRPLEFRLTSAVQPNRVQAILYGPSLQSFICGELIGKTLVDKATTPVKWVVTDSPHALDLRLNVAMPVALYAAGAVSTAKAVGRNLHIHPQFSEDSALIADLLEQSSSLDLAEPFQRIREAVAEARKMGPSQRAA